LYFNCFFSHSSVSAATGTMPMAYENGGRVKTTKVKRRENPTGTGGIYRFDQVKIRSKPHR
jgi:hypothetical protein